MVYDTEHILAPVEPTLPGTCSELRQRQQSSPESYTRPPFSSV